MVRVRIAPSPTGIPHIGNTRTALFNYLFAQHNKGKFMVRIEDTDRARLVPGTQEAIMEILIWLGLKWDGEVERQSDRLSIYTEHAHLLKKKGLVYDDNGAIRFRMPRTEKTQWQDAIGAKLIVFENQDQEDFVIIKSDGYPTYNFANVIDDHLMGITHVIRGEEFISSTPKHIQLYKAFGFDIPVFAHVPVILGPDKTKLSKRHGAKSVLDYRNDGYLKEALLNYMALLGWHPSIAEDKEIFSLSEMIELFDLKDVNTANPIFDAQKLEWMNGVYIRKSQIPNLKSQIISKNPKIKEIDDEILGKLIALTQTRMKTLNDFYELTKFVFGQQSVKLNDQEKKVAQLLTKELSIIKQWTNAAIFTALKKVLSQENIKMPVVYKVITGKDSGLPLPQTLEIIGKEKTMQLLNKHIS